MQRETPQLKNIEQVSEGWINKYVLTYVLPDGTDYQYEAVSRKGLDAYRAELERLGKRSDAAIAAVDAGAEDFGASVLEEAEGVANLAEKRVADAVREALGSADSRERIARMLADAEEERADEKPLSETIKGELAKIETAFSNIWAAIESGIAPPGGKERIDALKQRQALLKDELRTAEALEAARLDYDRALFWLEGMAAAEVDDAQLLRTFVARVVLGGPDDDDGLRVAFTFDDSAGLGDNPSLPGAIGPGGEVFDRMNASSTNSYK